MAYADYRYYITTYLGTAIQEADFPRLSLRASSFLDYYTQGRAVHNAGLDALKMACCAVAEQYQAIGHRPGAGAKGSVRLREIRGRTAKPECWKLVQDIPERRDSAQQALSSAQAAQASLGAIAQQYLGATGLLYRGRGCGYGHVSPYCDAL